MVYTLSKEGHIFCLNAENGDVVWSKMAERDFDVKAPKWAFAGSALILGDAVIYDLGRFVALNKKTGELIWNTEDYGSAYSSPIAFEHQGETYLASLPAYGLVIVNANDGKEIAKYQWETRFGINPTTPIVSGNRIFISSGYGKGGAVVELKNGKLEEVWKNTNMRNHMNSSVLWDGYLYGFDESTLKCVDFNDGSVKWSQNGLGKGSLMLADQKLIILSERGQLVIAEVSPESYQEISRAQVIGNKCWTIPVLANGKIYCRNAIGDFVCVDVSKP
jgi:outer membrane protein assembly factor BamB